MEISFALDFWIVLQLLILPVVLPLLVGLVTTRVTSSNKKAILLLALSVITSVLTSLLGAYQNGVEEFNLGLTLLAALATFVFGVGVQFGFLRPTGLTAKVQAIGSSSD